MKHGKLLFSLVILSLLVSMALPMVSAPKPGGGGKPPAPPPADPAIAFYKSTSKNNADRLMVMNADGSNQAVIYKNYFNVKSISWSPDGKSLAWSGYTYIPNVPGYEYGIWRIDVGVVDGVPQGSNLQQLVSCENIGAAAWSPVGDEIAYLYRFFYLDGSFTDRIDAVPATGGETFTIYTSPDGWMLHAGTSVTWRSDGTQLATTGGNPDSGEGGIMIIDRETGAITDTLLTGQRPWRVDWAQDLDILAFEKMSDPSQYIYTVDIETGVVVTVTDGFVSSWSPDNSKLVYLEPGRKSSLNTVDLDTGEIKTLASGSRPDWRRF